MTHTMKPLSFDDLIRWITQEFTSRKSIFGIHHSLFYRPEIGSNLLGTLYGQPLGTPVGPAAGPHTQLSQNIISAWLCGGRFIELKTVQVMDELDIPRPCIDMEDEGYNVEWSQELKLEQSAEQYVHAWIMIHLLPAMLGFDDVTPSTIFNMSVGYDLKGIQHPTLRKFMDLMENASEPINRLSRQYKHQYPLLAKIQIPDCITQNVTLSTMHGCPPDQIEKIALYLIRDRHLHTTVKLNPTLIGKEAVYEILHQNLGFTELHIPDSIFEHDLKYTAAVDLIRSLKSAAQKTGVTLGIKLSNTLAMTNHRSVLPGTEMYMSGRALYPVTMQLFKKIRSDFPSGLPVSFSAGADSMNIADILSSGACPVTIASDILKPGGYPKFLSILETIQTALSASGCESASELASDAESNLARAAQDAKTNPRYQKTYYAGEPPKTNRPLEQFDCVTAPCMDSCAVHQDVPAYIHAIGQKNPQKALEIILNRNPLPGITGAICTHRCQTRCTRINYDEPVAIRQLKEFAVDHATVRPPSPAPHPHRVAVIGSGPAGLSASYFLALHGIHVTIFESRPFAGGMPSIAPNFRLPRETIEKDIARIASLGVEIRCNHPVECSAETLLHEGFDAVFIGTGAQIDSDFNIEGAEGPGVLGALQLLNQHAAGEKLKLGRKVIVIGGGNTAMDSARTASRITGLPVTLVYRRTQAEMPAEEDEIGWFFEEGNQLIELASPQRIIRNNGNVTALECVRNVLGEPGPDGHRKPVPVPGSEFLIEADTIIPAIGQKVVYGMVCGSVVRKTKDGLIVTNHLQRAADMAPIYAGGDAVRGPAIIIEACEDGRLAAKSILQDFGIIFKNDSHINCRYTEKELNVIRMARIMKSNAARTRQIPVDQRNNFNRVELPLTEEQAIREAQRCLKCDAYCDKCVDVCPNRANISFSVAPAHLTIPVIGCHNNQLTVVSTDNHTIRQSRQILHLDAFCNECGNCASFCVHQGKPYEVKPRIYSDSDRFSLMGNNAYIVTDGSIYGKFNNDVASLTVRDKTRLFENSHIRVIFDLHWKIISMELKHSFSGTISLAPAVDLDIIHTGIQVNSFVLPAPHFRQGE